MTAMELFRAATDKIKWANVKCNALQGKASQEE